MLRFFGNVEGKVRIIFHDPMRLKSANADGVFQCLDKIFSDESPIKYSKLLGLGSDGASAILGCRNSVLTRLLAQQPSLMSFNCNCHKIAALIDNHACS